jgi:hypothetical protein
MSFADYCLMSIPSDVSNLTAAGRVQYNEEHRVGTSEIFVFQAKENELVP